MPLDPGEHTCAYLLFTKPTDDIDVDRTMPARMRCLSCSSVVENICDREKMKTLFSYCKCAQSLSDSSWGHNILRCATSIQKSI